MRHQGAAWGELLERRSENLRSPHHAALHFHMGVSEIRGTKEGGQGHAGEAPDTKGTRPWRWEFVVLKGPEAPSIYSPKSPNPRGRFCNDRSDHPALLGPG